MSDPFDIPERALPEHVRQQALRRIKTEIGDGRPRRRKTGLAPLLIAASVIALMAGATIVTSTLSSNKDPLDTKPPTPTTHPTTTSNGGFPVWNDQVSWAATDQDMQRCQAASASQGGFTPLLRVDRNGLTVLSYRFDTDIVFCEVTREQLTVERLPFPDPPTGKAPGKILFRTAAGTTAGVAAPGAGDIAVGQQSTQQAEPAAVGQGVFILPNGVRPADNVILRTDGFYDYDVPAADLPAVTPVTTTGSDPTADRSSADGQRLGACLNAANPPVPDADWWQPGAYLSVDSKHAIQLGILDGRVMACQQDEDVVTVDGPLDYFTYVGGGTEITAKLSGSNLSPPGEYFVGHTVDAKANSATLSVAGESDVTGTITNNTFVLYRPHPGTTNLQGQVKVKDATGAVIDQIPIHN
jgi:hypothetical protein